MKLHRLAWVVLVLGAGPALAAAAPSDLHDALRLARDNKCGEALAVVEEARRRPGFDAADPDTQRPILLVDLRCAVSARDWAKAHQTAKALTGLPDSTPELWSLRVTFANAAKQPEDAVEALETLAAGWPAAVRELDDDLVTSVGRNIPGKEPSPYRFRYLAALYAADFRWKEPFQSPDWQRADYAILLAERGEAAKAAEVASRIEDPMALLEISVDRGFAADVQARPQRYDLQAAAEATLVTHRRELALNPKLLAGVTAVSNDLRSLGRFQEALALLDEASARMAGRGGKAAFEDVEEKEAWVLNERAWVLSEMGRQEEAVKELRRAARINESGPNVSQVINLAELLNSMGRPDEALSVLADFEKKRKASPYGDMWMWSARACANAQLGRAADLARALEFVRTHEADNPAALSRALLCANDLDGAAASYVRRLGDVERRRDALIALSRFLVPEGLPPHRLELYRRLQTVAARPEVKAAIAAAGRVVEAPLYVTYWGDV